MGNFWQVINTNWMAEVDKNYFFIEYVQPHQVILSHCCIQRGWCFPLYYRKVLLIIALLLELYHLRYYRNAIISITFHTFLSTHNYVWQSLCVKHLLIQGTVHFSMIWWKISQKIIRIQELCVVLNRGITVGE